MRRARGFTLLEVVVALAVTATSLVILQRATSDALRAHSRLETEVQRRGAVRATLVHLVRELGGAVPGTLRIEPAPAGGTPLLEFAVDEPSPAVIRYRVAARRLERLVVPRFTLDGATGAPVPLLADVAAFSARARNRDGWHDTWVETGPPPLLALDLELASGERLATMVPLVAGAHP